MKTLIFIPTYNERENVEAIYHDIRRCGIDADLLFLDDGSPDGTGDVIDGLCRDDRRVHAIHRSGKQGIGTAHQAGIQWAYERGYERLVTLDCDFTHKPADIPKFLSLSDGFDVVVGSRFMRRESLADWNAWRKALTTFGHFLTRRTLGMPYDATGSFRVYRLSRIPRKLFQLVRSTGYSFFFESLYLLFKAGHTVMEIPIDLPARTYGHSKMSVRDAAASLKGLARLFLLSRKTTPVSAVNTSSEWDSYWERQAGGKGLYTCLAEIYRRRIIRPELERRVHAEFRAGAKLLHAGSGTGQVDERLSQDVRITALDISERALEGYRRHNGPAAATIKGSIFQIPAADKSFDGVYNLGVMEHLSRAEITRALAEFKRVLKPGGKILLFWPPSYGATVIVLSGVHFIANRLLRRRFKLFPDEITRVRSREHAEGMLREGGFRMTKYAFGLGDLFTHAIIVGEFE